MTSNVIINFGSNAAALFKDMQKVKSEMKAVSAQAVASTKAAATAARGVPMSFKQGLNTLRFGAGIITGFLGFNILREVFNPIKEGFNEVVRSSSGFTFAMDIATKTLTNFGAALGRLTTGNTASSIAQAFADVLFPGAPRLSVLSAAASAVKQNDTLLTGSQFMSPVSEQDKWEAKQLDVAKKQLAYVRETATSLRKIENDLDRMNMLDPW